MAESWSSEQTAPTADAVDAADLWRPRRVLQCAVGVLSIARRRHCIVLLVLVLKNRHCKSDTNVSETTGFTYICVALTVPVLY